MMLKKQLVVRDVLVNYYLYVPESPKRLVVFLHGWRSDATAWSTVLDGLGYGDSAMCAIDLPGFGQSQVPNRPYTLDDYVEVVDELTRKLGIQNLMLVGHSFGGRIAMRLTARLSAVKLLVLVDAAGITEITIGKKVKRGVAKIVRPVFRLSGLKSLRAKIYEKMGAGDYVATPYLQETFLNIIREDLRTDMARINTRTVIVWGEDDAETPVRWAHEMNALIRGSELTIIQGAGHFSFLDKPLVFIDILKRAINGSTEQA